MGTWRKFGLGHASSSHVALAGIFLAYSGYFAILVRTLAWTRASAGIGR